jgi:NADPH:quinone reductase-like Zn-dependent oxidoreductase
MALTLASAAGCHVVVTSSADDKIDHSVLLGAVGGVRYDRPNWPEAARQLSPAGRGFDVVLDAVGSWSDSLSAMRGGGRLVVLGASLTETAIIDIRRFYFGQFSLLGTTMGSPADFGGLLRFIDEHSVPAPVIDRTYPLSRAADAHAYLESGTAFGKVTLDIPLS